MSFFFGLFCWLPHNGNIHSLSREIRIHLICNVLWLTHTPVHWQKCTYYSAFPCPFVLVQWHPLPGAQPQLQLNLHISWGLQVSCNRWLKHLPWPALRWGLCLSIRKEWGELGEGGKDRKRKGRGDDKVKMCRQEREIFGKVTLI